MSERSNAGPEGPSCASASTRVSCAAARPAPAATCAACCAQWNVDDSARSHEFVLYAPEPLGRRFDARRFPTRIVAGAPDTWWEQVRLPPIAARDHLDVFFAPAYTAPLATRIPTVVAIHDVSFAAHPEWFSAREGLRRRTDLAARRQAVARRRHDLGVLAAGDHRAPRRRRIADPCRSRRASRRLDFPSAGLRAGRTCCTSGRSSTAATCPISIRAFATVARSHPDARLDIVGDNRTHPPEHLR